MENIENIENMQNMKKKQISLEYITKERTIMFAPEFNSELNEKYIELISNYSKLIFGDYALDFDWIIENYGGIIEYYEADKKSIDNTSLEPNLSKFNKSVGGLPNSLTHLEFGNNFNLEVNNLPSSIQTLIFGDKFNQEVNYLPSSIRTLVFGEKFNQKVNNLPSSINIIKFGLEFNQNIDNLPENIQQISIYGKFCQEINNLPSKLEYMCYGGKTKFNVQKCKNLNNFTKLKLHFSYNYPIEHLPKTITHLELNRYFEKPLIKKLPASLKQLKIFAPNTIKRQNHKDKIIHYEENKDKLSIMNQFKNCPFELIFMAY